MDDRLAWLIGGLIVLASLLMLISACRIWPEITHATGDSPRGTWWD